MRIALIAHDSRKELMSQFCTAYVRILSQNELIATGVTGKVVHDACGLQVRCLYPGRWLPSGCSLLCPGCCSEGTCWFLGALGRAGWASGSCREP